MRAKLRGVARGNRKRVRIVPVTFLEDARRNRLPATVNPPPDGFELREVFTWWVFDAQGYRLPVISPPADSWEDAEAIADELCRRHGWSRVAYQQG